MACKVSEIVAVIDMDGYKIQNKLYLSLANFELIIALELAIIVKLVCVFPVCGSFLL
jgi:hypothetical protein